MAVSITTLAPVTKPNLAKSELTSILKELDLEECLKSDLYEFDYSSGWERPILSRPVKDSERERPILSRPVKDSERERPILSRPVKDSERERPILSRPVKDSEQGDLFSRPVKDESHPKLRVINPCIIPPSLDPKRDCILIALAMGCALP